MAEARAAWGIDIGQSALKALKVRRVEGSDQVVAEAFDYIQFPKILSQPDAIPDEIVPQAMETFLSRNNLKGDAVAISVPGQSALARFIQLPPVESSKLHEIVKYEARQQIPFALEDVIWDYQPLGAGSEQGGFLLDAEVGLFAMKRDQVNQQMRPYNNAKVEIDVIQIAPLALYNVLSFDELGIRRDSTTEPGDEYYIVLDMGCDNTTLMVSNGFKIWIRNVPIGGNHFTRALTKEMKLSFAKAEHLKCNATKSPDPRAVFQALRPVFNDYVSEIQRSIGYFSSVNRAAKIAKVIGLGNGFKLAGLQKFLQQNLQYPVERPDNFQKLAGDAVLNSPLFSENLLSFAVPYGLGLQGLEVSRVRTSLLPPEITAARRIRRKKPWVVAAGAAALAALSLSTAVNANSYRAVNTPEFASAKREADDFKKKVADFDSAFSSQKSAHQATKQKLDDLTTGRRSVKWMDVFNAVVDAMPREENPEIGPNDIEKKKAVSISEFSSIRYSDVGSWFNSLRQGQKDYMTPEDRDSAPSGPGYIVTVKGEHWRSMNGDAAQSFDPLFLKDYFLKNFHQPTVQRPGYPRRDMTRLGISHATVMEQTPNKVSLEKPEDMDRGASRFSSEVQQLIPQDNSTDGSSSSGGGADPAQLLQSLLGGGGIGGRSLPQMLQSGGAGGMKEVDRTNFTIQFVLQYVPEEERPPLDEGATDTEAAETPASEE